MIEEFRDIPGYEGRYQVSNFGNVVSFAKGSRRELKPSITKQGYHMVKLTLNPENSRSRTVHLLVASAFMNHESDGTHRIVVDHIDDDKSNNKLSNLQLVSQRENSIKNGFKGFSRHKKTGLYFSRIHINGKTKMLGYFKNPEDARQAYINALKQLNEKV